MKLVSWNVNGIRACVEKGFVDIFKELDADFFCIQESKLQAGQIELDLPGYYQYWNYAQKKGYSGTAIFTKHEPLNVMLGIGVEEHDHEGRVVTLEYDDGIPENALSGLNTLFASAELIVPKKGKNGIQDQDIIPMIRRMELQEVGEKTIVLDCDICCQNPTLNPMQIVSAIALHHPEWKPDFAKCKRIEIFDNTMNVFR